VLVVIVNMVPAGASGDFTVIEPPPMPPAVGNGCVVGLLDTANVVVDAEEFVPRTPPPPPPTLGGNPDVAIPAPPLPPPQPAVTTTASAAAKPGAKNFIAGPFEKIHAKNTRRCVTDATKVGQTITGFDELTRRV
jgi:hypothetical protein